MGQNKIKIAYLDYSHIFAGAERVLYTIIANIDRKKYEPILIFPYPMDHHKQYASLSCKKKYLADRLEFWMGSERWNHPLRGTDFLARTIWGYKILRYLRRENVNILHVNLIRPDSLMWILPVKIKGVKVIGHFRSQALEWIPPKSVQKCCDLILCVSKYSQERMLIKGKYTHSIVLYDSIDVNSFKTNLSRVEAKVKLGFPEDCYLISSVGQLSRHKGHDNAIKAFAKIAHQFPQVVLYIAGGGGEGDLMYLKQISDKYIDLRDRIVFSNTQITNITEVYRASDLILSLTKVGEAFGLVPYEATIMGTPFIAPDKGAIKEFIVNMENGILVNTEDVNSIASCVRWAIEHTSKIEEMNIKAYNLIMEKLTPKVMTMHLEGVYKSLFE